MLRRSFFVGLGVVAAGISTAQSVFAGSKTYKYRCPKCKLIQEYGTPGVKKCPNDGSTMIRQN
jgi:predicted RNA-binding Zn-ribbon protein involved in translation (DUF1610 family)